MDGNDSDGVEIFGADSFKSFQIVVAVVDELFRVVFELKKSEPLDHDVRLVLQLLQLRGRQRRRRRRRRRSESSGWN